MEIEEVADLQLKFSVLENRPQVSSIIQATTSEQQEQNVLRVPREHRYYAFLDLVEEGYSAMFDQMPPVADLTLLGDRQASPETLGLGYDNRLEQPDIVVAHFDCVSCPFFEDILPVYRQYYDDNWVEGEIDAAHDLDAPLWRSPEQSLGHRRLNYLLNTEGTYKGEPRAVGVYLIFANTAANWHRFRHFFPEDGWYGLGLMHNTGFRIEIFFGDEDADDSAWAYGLANIYHLSQKKLNHLHHVYSLDFASDAYIAPEHDAPPEPISFRPIVPMPSFNVQPRRNLVKKKLQSAKLKRRISEPSGLIRKAIHKQEVIVIRVRVVGGTLVRVNGKLVLQGGTIVKTGRPRVIQVK